MIYLFFCVSLVVNGVLVWYIRKLLTKYWYDIDARNNFTQMLNDYSQSLESIYKLEELYGEEILKKAISDTKFVVQACEEFKEILEKETVEQVESDEEEGGQEVKETTKESVIRLKEGEKITQDAAKYKRVIPDQNF
jgi:hypothetical protein